MRCPFARLALALVLGLTLSSVSLVAPRGYAEHRAAAQEPCLDFPETGHRVCHGFRFYWEQFGGLAIFGYPLTDEFVDPATGRVTQWFERARFEWHPGRYPERHDVLLGLLGRELVAWREQNDPTFPTGPFSPVGPNPGCLHFAETGHNLCGGFRAYWERFGGLAVFGYPISEEFREVNPDDGQEYVVQYFERQRFEWHPGAWPERYDVLLGRLGHTLLEVQTATPTIRFEEPRTWTPSLTPGLRVVAQRGLFPAAQADVLFRIVEGPNQNLAWRLAGRTDDWGGLWIQYTGAGAGLDRIEACVDMNRNGSCDADEPRASAEVWVGLEFNWTVSPGQTLLVGQDASVTFTLALGGRPFAGARLVVIYLEPESFTIFTDERGQAALHVVSPNAPGFRYVYVCLDTEGDESCGLILLPGTNLTWVTQATISTNAYPVPGTARLVGQEHALSFNVYGVSPDGGWGGSLAAVPVRLVVTGANAHVQSILTNSSGYVEFRYRGELGGTDLITACVDLNRNDACDADEPVAGPFAHHWVTGAQLAVTGLAVDNDPATRWLPGESSPAFQVTATLEPALDPEVAAPRLFVEFVDETASARGSGGEQAVRWFSGVPLDVSVLNGGPGDRLRVRVWLDSDAGGWLSPDEDDLLLEREVTLTE